MFKDRIEAGEVLANKIKEELGDRLTSGIVLGIPRGGIEIGLKVSNDLGLIFDSVATKKLPAPDNEAVTIGAISEGGVIYWEDKICTDLGVTPEYKMQIAKVKLEELGRKEAFYRRGEPLPDLTGKIAILVDDCVVTGTTMKASIEAIRVFKPDEIVIAVPVIGLGEIDELKQRADRVIYLEAPELLFSLSEWYADFEEATDEELKQLMDKLLFL